MARKNQQPAGPAGRNPPQRPRGRKLLLAAGVLILLAAAAAWLLPGGSSRITNPRWPQFGPTQPEDERAIFARYGGSTSCRECHAEEYALWEKSNHGLAERPLREDLDRTAFVPSREIPLPGEVGRAEWDASGPGVTCVGISGSPERHPVARVIGNDPLRQYLVPFPGGRFQALQASYDPRSNEWFNVYGSEQRHPGEWGHWTGRGMNWNYMCANCHNTRLRQNYDEATDTYRTAMAEMTVGCEACHGPLRAHNEWQRQHGQSGRKDPTLPKFSKPRIVDNCGSCHARRSDLTPDFKPGDAFNDQFALSIVDQSEIFYADGQIHDEDYEYSSFLSSRMHFRGVTCLDCHNPHSGKTLLPGNWLCMRCHDGSYEHAPRIEPVQHSHHRVYGYDAAGKLTNPDLSSYDPARINETGGECVNCHMPQTYYMQRHRRHDHGFTIPDPLLTRQFGIPNACNRCHADQDAEWALAAAEKWYGPKMERPTRARAQWVARARRGDTAARDPLLRMLREEEIASWRASAAELLDPWAAQPEVVDALLEALNDTNALVRASSVHALEPALSLERSRVRPALARRLEDDSRNVRVAAAWAMRATLDTNTLAGRELLQLLEVSASQPAGQLRKGVFAYSRNDPVGACEHLGKAVAWDPYSSPIRQQYAVALSAAGKTREAIQTLRDGLRLVPRDAELQYQLGLAENEAGNLGGAAEALRAAVEANPQLALAWYNLGLAQSALDQPEQATESLLRAESLSPQDPRIPYARATILARLGRNQEALAAVRQALSLRPVFPEAERLLERFSR